MTTSDPTSTRSTSETDSEGIVQTARSMVDSVAGAAGEVSARLPEVAQTTRDALAETNRMVQQGSDETLKVLGAASIGMAAGLLVGGANRLLVVLSLLPAALIGATLVERGDGTVRGTGPRSKVTADLP
jgi:hypothetical protein